MKSTLLSKALSSVLFLLITLWTDPSFGQAIISTFAGSLKSSCSAAPCGEGGLAIDAKLYSPAGIAVDPDDNIYIIEFSNHCVRKVDVATGIITTVAGAQRSSCQSSPCGDGGLATDAQLNGPRGAAFDAAGNMYIADFSNHAIRKVDKTTGIITTVAGTLKSACGSGAVPCGDGGLATAAQLNSPTGLAFDAAGNMYIADYGNHAIRRVDAVTGIITTVAGTQKTSCSTSPCGDGGLATSAFLYGPSGIAVGTDGNLYIAEYGNHAVRKVDMTTGIITTVAGLTKSSCSSAPCGDGGLATAARLTSPFSLTVDHNNNIFIADASNAAIRKVDQATGIISTVAGTIKSSCSTIPCGDGGSPTAAQLSNPFGVVFNSMGDMYIVEYSNQAVRKVNFSVLPVKMSQVLAYENRGAVDIRWKAMNETNVARYGIERSPDSYSFRAIGEMAARADGAAEISYRWSDKNPMQGNNYYRIKSSDIDESYSYSSIVKVNLGEKAATVRVFPNPVIGRSFHVQITNSEIITYYLSLYDTKGQKVYSHHFLNQPGTSAKEINLPPQLSSGVYFLNVSDGNQVVHKGKIFLKK